MRTTITLEPDTEALLKTEMERRGTSFKEAVNQAIRAGLGPRSEERESYTTPRALGPTRVDLTKALRIAAELEDDALTLVSPRGDDHWSSSTPMS